MSTHVQFLGHSCILIEHHGKRLLIDPFLNGNPKAAASAETIHPHLILVSHGHEDHLGDTIPIAKRTGAPVIANFEIGQWLQADPQSLEHVHGMQHGGGHDFGWVHVKLTLAFHGSTIPGGGYGGNPAGFLLKFKDGPTLYDAADTALFGDMKLIGEACVDLAFLPIGDYYTMGPDDALKAVQLINPARVVPIHYNTFPIIRQDPHLWADRVQRETKSTPHILEPGESLEIPTPNPHNSL